MGDQSLESARWHVRTSKVEREGLIEKRGGLITPRESRFREEIGQFRKYVRAVSVLLSRTGGREGDDAAVVCGPCSISRHNNNKRRASGQANTGST